MTRDRLTRMDVDTGWAYHRKTRKLQQQHPERWPVYWAAYMALLGECWQKRTRNRTLEDAWVPALPCSVEEAREALVTAGVTDKAGRIPAQSWREWFGPTKARIDQATKAAEARWDKGGNAPALRGQNGSNANSQPASTASQPRGREGLTPLRETLIRAGLKPELAAKP